MGNHSRSSRRSFLKGLAAFAGASVAATTVAGQAPAPDTRTTRVALLVPHSERQPRLAEEIVRGMSIGLASTRAHDRVRVELKPVPMLPSGTSREIAGLLEARTVDLIATLAQPAAIPALAPLVERARVPLLALDAGANMPRKDEHSPYVFTQTLDMWRSAWAAGAWAARNVGPSAVIVGSFCDLGYDLAFAFEAGFRISGGQTVATHMTDAPARPGRHDWPGTLATVHAHKPDLVYLLNSDGSAGDFLRAYSGSARIMATQLVVESSGNGRDSIYAGVTSVAPWALDRDAHRELALREGLGLGSQTQPAPYARLGFETGVRLGTAVTANGPLLDALAAGDRESSPAGHRSSAGTEISDSRLYVRETLVGVSGVDQRWIADAPSERSRTTSLASLANAPRTGWVYPYLTT